MESSDTTEDDLDQPIHHVLRNRIEKILCQIQGNVVENEALRFINIIRKAVEMKPDDVDTKVEESIDEFTDLKMMITILGRVMISNTADFDELDEATVTKYLEILKEGYERVRHIRLMVVGMFAVGKTTIIRRLCNKEVLNVNSTVGIDVSVNACEIDDKNEWKVTHLDEKKKKYYKSRIANAHMKSKQPIVAIERISPKSLDVEEQKKEIILKEVKVDTLPKELIKPKVELPTPVEGNKSKAVEESSRQNLKKLTAESEPTTKEYFDDVKAAVDDKKLVKPERITTVSIWDFAGQSIYYSTHHFFLSARAIYLLVLNISQKLDAQVQELEKDGLATPMPTYFTYRDAFKFWMNSIYTYTASRNDTLNLYSPTIVLVGTFKDVVKYKHEEKDKAFLEKYKEEYFNDALKSFYGSEVIKLVHKKKFFVSKEDPAEVFSALKNELSSIAENQPFWNQRVPMKWIPLERSIEVRKTVLKQTADASLNDTGSSTTNKSNAKGAEVIQSKNELKYVAGNKADDTDNTNENSAIMKLKELEEMDRSTELSLADIKQIKIFLNFQHALGNLLYYDAEQLEDTIILDPQWILNVFKLFVSHVREKQPTQLEDWDNYNKNAILSLTLIDELITQAEDATFTGNKDKIIQYMDYLHVIAKPVVYREAEVEDGSSSDEEDENRREHHTKDFYIVPCVLSRKPSDLELKKTPEHAKSTPILCMVFKNDFLPAFVCHRLMATCIKKWEVATYKGEQLMVFNGMGRFLLNPGKTMWLSLWWKDNIIYMQIVLCTNKNKPVDGPKCTKVLQHVKQMIREIFSIHRNFTGEVGANQKTLYDECIKCPECVKNEAKVHVGSEGTELAPEENITEKSKMLLVHNFAKEDEVNCEHNHTIGRDAALSKWFFERHKKHKIAKLDDLRKGVFKWFREYPEDNDKITELLLTKLSEHIGKEYIVLGIELGLNFKTIEQINMEEKNIKTCTKNIFLEWMKNFEGTPTVGHIKSVILKVLGICLKNREFQEEEINVQTIVKWFETKLDTDMPTERELLEVAYFVDGNYKKLRNPLCLEYSEIEQIEKMYSLDITRTLVVLLQWKQKNNNVSYNTLKNVFAKLWKKDWEGVKAQIEKDK